MECTPFYQNNTAPIWYGRVEGMLPQNQNLYVYGYVTSKQGEKAKIEILEMKFSMKIRGKNADDEVWEILNPDAPFQDVRFFCDGASELCTYFPVGYVPELKYQMYDVAIEVLPDSKLAVREHTSINFHIAWVNSQYTIFQLAFRGVFTICSLIILCLYMTKILCRVPDHLKKDLTFE